MSICLSVCLSVVDTGVSYSILHMKAAFHSLSLDLKQFKIQNVTTDCVVVTHLLAA